MSSKHTNSAVAVGTYKYKSDVWLTDWSIVNGGPRALDVFWAELSSCLGRTKV